MSETESYLSTGDAAKILGVRPQTLLKYCNRGKIRGAFYCRRWHFLAADLHAYAQSNRRGKL